MHFFLQNVQVSEGGTLQDITRLGVMLLLENGALKRTGTVTNTKKVDFPITLRFNLFV